MPVSTREPHAHVRPSDPTEGWRYHLDAVLPNDRVASGLVLLVGALLFFPFLGSVGLWDPWEPHYSEVAREMLARKDLVHPHWESAYFFSKPALPLWMIAAGLWVVQADSAPIGEALGSYVAWGVRLPFALVAIGTLWAGYRIGRLIGGRSVGFLAAIVLGSCPQFIFIGKQAIADMPLVGFMTVGLAMFLEAMFEDHAHATARPSMWERSGSSAVLGILGYGQVFILGQQVQHPSEAFAVASLASGVTAAILLTVVYGRRRHIKLAVFYAFMAAAALSKGLAVLAIVGPVVLLYMILALDFGLLLRSGLWWGVPLFLMLASPWYVAMSLFTGRDDEGLTFVARFWIHDNLNRVGAGVHGDRGGLGYHLEQLAYGMFPWSALVPAALLNSLQPSEEGSFRTRRVTLFLVLWALWSYVFFSASLTKFHHYIFPAVPPLAVLVASWFAWVGTDPRERLRGGIHILIAALFAAAAIDLINNPQHLVNLFTYKYDREWPQGLGARNFLLGLVLATATGLVSCHVLRRRGGQQLVYLSSAVVFAAWCSHVHFNLLSQHWSQYHVFETYYQERNPGEPLYAYQLNWRGETFYSRNTTLQIMKKGANRRIRQLVERPGREFILTEQRRLDSLRNSLGRDKRDKIKIIDQSNLNFYLVLVED
ncbi:MAG: ArnT family glycosyltransferase [Myxococcota bacterium]